MDGPSLNQGVGVEAISLNPSLMVNGVEVEVDNTDIELALKKTQDSSENVPNVTISPDEVMTSILSKAQKDPKSIKLSQCLQNLNAQMIQGIAQQQQPQQSENTPQLSESAPFRLGGHFTPNLPTSTSSSSISSSGILESFVDLIQTLASMSNDDDDEKDSDGTAKKSEDQAITVKPEPVVPKIVKEIIDQKKLLAGDCMMKETNNYIQTHKSIVVGERNTIIGHCNNISGDGNCIRGSLNTISGDRNKIYGNDNKVYGNWNRVYGLDNEVIGENNKEGVEEEKNTCIIN